MAAITDKPGFLARIGETFTHDKLTESIESLKKDVGGDQDQIWKDGFATALDSPRPKNWKGSEAEKADLAARAAEKEASDLRSVRDGFWQDEKGDSFMYGVNAVQKGGAQALVGLGLAAGWISDLPGIKHVRSAVGSGLVEISSAFTDSPATIDREQKTPTLADRARKLVEAQDLDMAQWDIKGEEAGEKHHAAASDALMAEAKAMKLRKIADNEAKSLAKANGAAAEGGFMGAFVGFFKSVGRGLQGIGELVGNSLLLGGAYTTRGAVDGIDKVRSMFGGGKKVETDAVVGNPSIAERDAFSEGAQAVMRLNPQLVKGLSSDEEEEAMLSYNVLEAAVEEMTSKQTFLSNENVTNALGNIEGAAVKLRGDAEAKARMANTGKKHKQTKAEKEIQERLGYGITLEAVAGKPVEKEEDLARLGRAQKFAQKTLQDKFPNLVEESLPSQPASPSSPAAPSQPAPRTGPMTDPGDRS